MKRKNHWVIALPPEKFINILYQSTSNGYVIWSKKNEIVIRHPRYIFGGTIPVNFQVSFIGKLVPSMSNTILNGKFGAHRLFYIIFYVLFFSVSLLFLYLSDYYQKNLVSYFLFCFLSGLLAFFVIRFMIFISIKVFKKENLDVINLLDSIQAEYGQQQNNNR